MRYRQIGSSDLTVSEISLGSWLTYGGGVGDEQARACVAAAFDAGINFIDTANVYALGAAEELLGDVLQGRPRGSYVLATKLYFPMDDSGENEGLSREQVHKQIDESLRRLRTEYVDLYQCHRYDSRTPLEETMAALTEVVRAGKARYVGFSEWTAPQIQASLDLSSARGWERFVSSQPQYSMLWREPEREVIPLCRESDISQIVWSPLAQGALTGKYRPGSPPPEGSRATSRRMGRLMGRWLDDGVLERVQRLVPVAERLGITMAQLALAWVLREENVASAIVGASRPEQVRDNAAASGIDLDAETLSAVETILGQVLRTMPRRKPRSQGKVIERCRAMRAELQAALARLPAEADDPAVVDAVWRGEALGTLLWGLQLVELPAYDHPFDPDTVVLVDPADGDLREAEDIELERESARLWHWRARTTELQAAGRLELPARYATIDQLIAATAMRGYEQGVLPSPMRGDFHAYGKVYRHLTPEQHAEAHSVALERHHALNWLCGAGSDWDDVPLDT